MYRHIVGSLIYMTITKLDLNMQLEWWVNSCKHHESHIWMQ
jgi:hypothetical protein